MDEHRLRGERARAGPDPEGAALRVETFPDIGFEVDGSRIVRVRDDYGRRTLDEQVRL